MNPQRTEYLSWINYHVTPAAEQYADDFFQHLCASMDEKAQELLAMLETEQGTAWAHDMTIPAINEIILLNMEIKCRMATRGWRELYERGLKEHFQER